MAYRLEAPDAAVFDDMQQHPRKRTLQAEIKRFISAHVLPMPNDVDMSVPGLPDTYEHTIPDTSHGCRAARAGRQSIAR